MIQTNPAAGILKLPSEAIPPHGLVVENLPITASIIYEARPATWYSSCIVSFHYPLENYNYRGKFIKSNTHAMDRTVISDVALSEFLTKIHFFQSFPE